MYIVNIHMNADITRLPLKTTSGVYGKNAVDYLSINATVIRWNMQNESIASSSITLQP